MCTYYTCVKNKALLTLTHAKLLHSVSKHRCYVLEQYHEIDRRIVNLNDLPKRSTEGERSPIKHFVRSLSMPHELLMSMRIFF